MLRRWIKSFRQDKDAPATRALESVADLRAGDLVTFKSRLSLPDELRDATLEVSGVTTYQYDDGLYLQATLVSTERNKFYLGYDPSDRHGELCLSKPVGHSDIETIFDTEQFADLFEEGYSDLAVSVPSGTYVGWCTPAYKQTKNMAVGFHFDRDVRGENVSSRQDDDSEEMRYHELKGDDDQFEITIEIWGDGDTDVSLDVYCPPDVIETLWPGES